MKQYIVKPTHTNGQTRIAIPKTVAQETGLDKAVVVVVEIMADKSIKIWEWYHARKEDSSS